MVKIKICGITNMEDAIICAERGVDVLGFIFYDKSPRYVEPKTVFQIRKRLPPFITTVGVFVNSSIEAVKSVLAETNVDCVQFHGDESPGFCDGVYEFADKKVIKAFRIRERLDIQKLGNYNVDAYLLDTYREGVPGGTGETFDWNLAAEAKSNRRIILSGGLTPENISRAIKLVRPYAVDVSSGVEAKAGKKDSDKLKKFIDQVRRTN